MRPGLVLVQGLLQGLGLGTGTRPRPKSGCWGSGWGWGSGHLIVHATPLASSIIWMSEVEMGPSLRTGWLLTCMCMCMCMCMRR